MKLKSVFPSLALIAALLSICGGCATRPQEKTKVRALIAGSLMIPFDALEKAFEAEHADVDVEMEAHGSIQVIRHVTEIHELSDLVFTADHALIPMLMYSSRVPETDKPYADWYIKFATNKLGLAYSPKSKYADEINADNWYKIIARPDVKVGIADPRFDAAGYRAFMALQLAKAAYGKPTILEDVIMGQFKTPVTMQEENGRAVIHVPEIVDTKKDSNIVIRGASIQLIALLQSGDLDYAFEYESVIQQHQLKLVKPQFDGEVIGYGVTIPSNAPHPKPAQDLIAFLLGPKGRAVMEANQHPLFTPPLADHYDLVPQALKSLCTPLP